MQFGGPVGTLDKFGDKGPSVAAALASRLGPRASRPLLAQRARHLAEFAGWLSLVTGILGKIGQDIALLAQNEIADVTRDRRPAKSSAMHHKQNPVLAEILVTLARFNATQVSGMHQALVHEQERSGAAWTLEWMVLPQMAVADRRGAGARTDPAGRLAHQRQTLKPALAELHAHGRSNLDPAAVSESLPFRGSISKIATQSEFWFATSSHRPVESSAKLRGVFPPQG